MSSFSLEAESATGEVKRPGVAGPLVLFDGRFGAVNLAGIAGLDGEVGTCSVLLAGF